MLYYLKLPSTLQKLHLVFLVVKLIVISADFIPRKYSSSPLNLAIIDEKKE